MKESRYVFYCDSCYTTKNGIRKELDPDSVESCIYRQPFRCIKKEQWGKHLKTEKHIRNITNANNIKDELLNECKHCGVRLDDRSYKIHTERNYMYWASKGFSYTKDCSCNNFILDGKRFNTFGALRDYDNIKENYSYGKDNKIDYRKKLYDEAHKIVEDKENHIKDMLEARKRSEENMRKKLEEKKEKEKENQEKKVKKIIPLQENIQLTIEDEFNTLNGIEEKVNPKTDLNEPPDFCDFCGDCGKPDNSISEYSIEKLERYDIDICDCESDEDSDSDEEKII
tara:strand:- start:33 stop:884 length:852 start_codon:yes stop_codon:yes gene_type:complete